VEIDFGIFAIEVSSNDGYGVHVPRATFCVRVGLTKKLVILQHIGIVCKSKHMHKV
jgi:hypothetical protein